LALVRKWGRIVQLKDYFVRLWSGFAGATANDKLPLFAATVYVVLALAALASVGIVGFPISGAISLASTFLAVAVFVYGSIYLVHLCRDRPDGAIQYSRAYFAEKHPPEALARNLPIILAVCLFLPAFSTLKSSISLFSSYTWDQTFISLDRMIHGGDAWMLIHPLVGYPFVTFVLGTLYMVWLPLLLVSVIFFALVPNRPVLRSQFLLSFFSCWGILGSMGAVMFASVGPCFVKPLLGQDEFAPLMDYLAYADTQWPIWVIHVQDLLARQLVEGSRELGAGITAMPSMHVSIATLYWLAARRLSRWFGWLAFVYLLLIMAASVHLAYHYAIDGYVSFILTFCIWKLAGKWAERSPSA
jgi:hypothetical protein